MWPRGLTLLPAIPQHPGGQSTDMEAELIQDVAEQEILFEAVTPGLSPRVSVAANAHRDGPAIALA